MINLTDKQTERLVCAFEKMAEALTDLADSTNYVAGAIENKRHLDIELYGLRPIVEVLKDQTETIKSRSNDEK